MRPFKQSPLFMAVEELPVLGSSKREKCSRWEEWRPVVYCFAWGPSLTRGCTLAWIFLTAPYYVFQSCMDRASAATYVLCGSPRPGTCWSYVPMYAGLIPAVLIALVWIIVTILLFIPWLLLYLIVALFECIVMVVYYGTCRYGGKDAATPQWRSFSCSGWVSEWREGYDPNTAEVWSQWSPIHTLCSYNFPPV